MTILILGAAAFFLITFALHLASIAIAMVRCRADRRHEFPPLDAPPVSLIRPVCGIENYCEETLRSTFELDYPRYEILFCAAHVHDPVLPSLSAVVIAGTAWYGAEAMMARASGWHSSVRAPLVWMLRDLLLPALWVQAWLGSTFVWRGNHMHVARPQPVG